MSELDPLLTALRARLPELRRHVRPSPVGTSPLPWRSDPTVQAIEGLRAAPRRAAIATLLDDDDPLMRAIGVHLIIEGEHRDLLGDAVAVLGELEPTPQAGVLDEEDAHAADSREILATMIVVAIGRLRGVEHHDLLRQALEHAATFWAAVESLALIGGASVLDDLQRAIDRHADPWDRLDVVKVIGDLGGDYAVPILRRILADRDVTFAPLRGYAAQALGTRGGPGVARALVDALDEPTMLEKGRVLWGLWQLADPQTFEAIEPWLEPGDERKPWWRAEALKALAASDPRRARDRVLEVIATDDLFQHDREAFADAVRALGHLHGDAAARAVLVDHLRVLRGLDPVGDTATPTWLTGAGARLESVILTALGQHHGLDLTPDIEHRESTEAIVARQAATLRPEVEPDDPLLEALPLPGSPSANRPSPFGRG